jgi:glycosyltransferase involved in cell wall biosynthesis
MKKTILHFINNFNRGGAERMLVTVIKELKEYNNIIVTLEDLNDFGSELTYDKYICLYCPSPASFPIAAIKLRKVIKKYKPDIVHSHLFWPTFIARIATPKKIPLVTTIHAFIATSADYQKNHIIWIDRISYHFRKSIIIAVAQGALKEYFSFLKLKPYKAYSLYTFVDTRLFNDTNASVKEPNGKFRLISVGTLKGQKNHHFFIEAFKQLKDEKFELHIYGNGWLKTELEKSLKENNITNIKLKGSVKNIHQLIPQYDLFTMASKFEGFSLAVLEAMALSMPMLLSDIESFREQCESTAEYFELTDINQYVSKLKLLSSNPDKLDEMGNAAKQRVLTNFTLEHHLEGLRKIYTETLPGDQ